VKHVLCCASEGAVRLNGKRLEIETEFIDALEVEGGDNFRFCAIVGSITGLGIFVGICGSKGVCDRDVEQ